MIEKTMKAKYNVLIAYERKFRLKEFDDGNYQQQYFYRDNHQQTICSSRTYCRMEKNEVCTNDEIYLFAAKKLGKEIKALPKIDRFLDSVISTVYDHMERLEELEAARVIDQALRRLDECKDVLYYEEFIWQFKMMRKYFLNVACMMNEKEFERIFHTFKVFPRRYQEILMHFAYLYSNAKEMYIKEKVLSIYNFKNSKFICNQISCIQVSRMNQENYDALMLCNKLEAYLEENGNHVQLLSIYVNMFSILVYFDKKASVSYMEKAIKLSGKYNYHINRLSMLYMNLGTSCLLLKEFKNSLVYLEKECKMTDSLKMRHYLCICHCYNMLKEPVPEEYLTCDEKFGDMIDNLVYNYFKFRGSRTREQNNAYIMNKVSKKLLPNDLLYLKIMSEELCLIAETTNHYKTYYKFRKLFNM